MNTTARRLSIAGLLITLAAAASCEVPMTEESAPPTQEEGNIAMSVLGLANNCSVQITCGNGTTRSCSGTAGRCCAAIGSVTCNGVTTQCPSCGNGSCQPGETCENCPQDCLCPTCPNGECNFDETCATCPQDCGACAICTDGVCDPGENCVNCPEDCEGCPPCGQCQAPSECGPAGGTRLSNGVCSCC